VQQPPSSSLPPAAAGPARQSSLTLRVLPQIIQSVCIHELYALNE
jgi:hypothetical protein